jgi:tetratricopeptide (TPR) repeat protein
MWKKNKAQNYFINTIEQPKHHYYIYFFLMCMIVIITLKVLSFESSYDKAERYFEKGNYEKALEYYDNALLKDRKDYGSLYSKGVTLGNLERYFEAIEVFKTAEKIKETDENLYIEMGYAYYNVGNFKDSIDTYKKVLKLNSKNTEAITWIAYNNVMLGDYDEAITLCDQALAIDKGYDFAYETKGEAYYYNEEFKEAIKYYNMAIAENPTNIENYILKSSSLGMLGEYTDAIKLLLETNHLYPNQSMILQSLGDVYSEIEEHSNAIRYYEDAFKLDDKSVELAANIGWGYYYEQNYEQAKNYAKKALELDNSYSDALFLDKTIKNEKRPEAEKIVEFITENYLYIDKVENFEQKSKDFLAKTNVTNEDINKFIELIRIKEDIFTFVVKDKEYDDFIKYESSAHITWKMLNPKSLYVNLETFAPKVDTEFRNIIKKVTDNDKLSLIIDLRDNGGGLSEVANNILDMLLPEKTTSYTIDRDGNVGQFYSGKGYTKFEKIIVLVNENSASSSELLALSLKKHLNNVTIVGRPTFGKGVGQISFENKSKRYCIFLVNFYWNVKERNIAGDRIRPDKAVKGSNFNDYMRIVNELINN